VTLALLDALSECIEKETDGQYFLLLGSTGALVAILFGAPHSAFAQPRAVIGSNMIAAFIAVSVHILSSPAHLNAFPRRVAVAIAPATAIAVNHRLGLLHPPAAAAALIFVSGGDEITAMGWMYLLTPLLVANTLCLVMALVFNNLSSTRQFPLYWLGGRDACSCARHGDGSCWPRERHWWMALCAVHVRRRSGSWHAGNAWAGSWHGGTAWAGSWHGGTAWDDCSRHGARGAPPVPLQQSPDGSVHGQGEQVYRDILPVTV